ncbi:hypothetical protein EGW08_007613 [Elysia chlorotica]|uniref:Uncharacterized protein n=1 Tax=Elysia chlorotica TaxID=188477 RepID=A0A3S1BIK7_ELYCH|nr:hypothetical protein EGW08_007613 [Elysia chlorotica]
MAMVQMYVALLIRPQYLLHLLEHAKVGDGHGDSKLLLQHQTSLDDVDQPPNSLVDAQHRILKLVVKALLCLKHFTPVLPEILLDQSVDVSEWQPVLQLSFGTPSLDGDVSGFSFGTLLNCVTACIRMLTKNDSRALSPHRASPDPKQAQVPRPVVQLALELSLEVLLSQACRYLRDPNLTPRDRQFLKRELGTELNSCLSPLNRQMRRSGGGDKTLSVTPPGTAGVLLSLPGTLGQGSGSGPSTPQTGTGGSRPPPLTPQMSRSSSQTFSSTQDPAYFRLVHAFVQKVLK